MGVISGSPVRLVTTTTRLALDRLRRLKTERDAYFGPWLPEPIVGGGPAPAPDRHLDLADDLSMAFLTLLERLAPEERAAFLLHDVFEVDYRAIASVIGRSEAACRQVVHRALERVRGERKRFETTEEAKTALLQRFLAAVEARDEQALLALFAPDASWTADSGGKTPAEGDYSHLGFALGSRAAVDAVAARARAEGRLLWPPKQEPWPVGYYCGVVDPDGVMVEFSYGQPLGPGAAQGAGSPP